MKKNTNKQVTLIGLDSVAQGFINISESPNLLSEDLESSYNLPNNPSWNRHMVQKIPKRPRYYMVT